MFGNQNQSSNNGNGGFNNQINVTTRLYNSYSDTAALNVSAWNEQISIRLSPFRGKSPEGIRLYSQDNNECIQTALTMDNVSALLEGINDTIIPSLVDKTPGVVAVMVGTMANKKIVAIDTDGTDVELTIYVGVDTIQQMVLEKSMNRMQTLLHLQRNLKKYISYHQVLFMH